jgi:hypothetical protein
VPHRIAFAALLVPATVRADPGYFDRGAAPPALPDPGAIVALVPFDADGDGDEDLFAAYGARNGPDGATVALPDRLLLATPGGWTLSSESFDAAAPAVAADAVAFDADGDGDRDLLVAGGTTYSGGANGGTVAAAASLWYRNLGGGRFAAPVEPWFRVRLTGIAAQDLDADGDVDVVTTSESGFASVFRNDTAGAAAPLQLVARGGLAVSPPGETVAAVRPVFGRFLAGGGTALAVLHRSGSSVDPGVAFYAATNSQPPLALLARVAIPARGAQMMDLAAGELDPASGDELVVAALPGVQQDGNPSVLLRREAGGYAVAPLAFGGGGARRVRIADLDGDARDDVVFALSRLPDRCGVEPRASASQSLQVLLQSDGGLAPNGQCLGTHVEGARALALARGATGALPSIVASGPAADCPALAQDEVGAWTNDAPPTAARCCLAELAAGQPGVPRAGLAALAGTLSTFDAQVYLRVRDELLAPAANGPRLVQRYYAYSPEIVGRLLLDDGLRAQAGDTLGRWAGLLESYFAGGNPIVDTAAIDAVDAFLQALAANGSAALAQAIAEERAALPPFASLAGLPFDAFVQQVLPREVLLRDGFEAIEP